MRKIQILGSGCPKCRKLAEHARQAVDTLGLDAEIEKITQVDDIIRFGVMMTPALAVDGQVKISGTVSSVAEIKALLTG